jgi:hypothetical protein
MSEAMQDHASITKFRSDTYNFRALRGRLALQILRTNVPIVRRFARERAAIASGPIFFVPVSTIHCIIISQKVVQKVSDTQVYCCVTN